MEFSFQDAPKNYKNAISFWYKKEGSKSGGKELALSGFWLKSYWVIKC